MNAHAHAHALVSIRANSWQHSEYIDLVMHEEIDPQTNKAPRR